MNPTIAGIQSLLRRYGLPTDFGDAIAQLAHTIRDHKHFETVLTGSGPKERQELYDAVVPHLRFTPKALDQYVADAGQMAERQQLPVQDEKGNLHPFKAATDASSARKYAEDVLLAAMAKRTLTLTCSKCLREEQFYQIGAETEVDTILKARRAGWIYDYKADPAVEICPVCPTSLRTVN